MKFESYAEACIPPTYTILGRRLENLCLGHYLLMRRLGSNYASDVETGITIEDLITAVLVCSMTYEECIKFFSLPSVRFWSWDNVKTLGYKWYLSKQLGPTGYEIRCWGNKLSRLIKKRKEYCLLFEFRSFQQYISEGLSRPLYYTTSDSEDNKQSGAHWSVCLKSFLLTKYTESEAMNLPLRQAFFEYCRWAEEQGSIEFLQPFEEDMAKGILPL